MTTNNTLKSVNMMSFTYLLSTILLLIPSPLTNAPKSSLFAVALSTNTNTNTNNNNNNPNQPNRRTKIKNAPLALSEELGCSPTLTALKEPFKRGGVNKKQQQQQQQKIMVYFDPLQLATDQNFGRYREAELKHGRVSMLVVVICLTKTWFQQEDPVEYFRSGQTPHVLELLQNQAGIGVGGDVDNNLSWLVALTQVLGVCGILETLLLVQASPQDMPGDYGLGYFGVRDKGLNERSLVSELENGRLAMMTMLYWVVAEVIPPSVSTTFQELVSSSSQRPEFSWDAFMAVLGGANLMGEIITATGTNGVMNEVVTTATSVVGHVI